MIEVFNNNQGVIAIVGLILTGIGIISSIFIKNKGDKENMNDTIFNGPINVNGDLNNNINGNNIKSSVVNTVSSQDDNILKEYKDDLRDIIEKFGDRNKELDLHYSYRIKNNKITLNSKMYAYSVCYEKDKDIIYFISKANFDMSLIIGDLVSFISKINKEGI